MKIISEPPPPHRCFSPLDIVPAAGTVAPCEFCLKVWVSDREPLASIGQQSSGRYWRPATESEIRKARKHLA